MGVLCGLGRGQHALVGGAGMLATSTSAMAVTIVFLFLLGKDIILFEHKIMAIFILFSDSAC